MSNTPTHTPDRAAHSETEYIVRLESFQGPLDLLHQLIEERKLHINTISLATVTADYLSHIREVATVSAEEVARFTHIAAVLILIKSKSLLPMLEYTAEEESDVAVLEARLRLLDTVRSSAVPPLERWGAHSHFVRPPSRWESVAFLPDDSCTVAGLHRNARAVISDLPFFRRKPEKKVAKVISVEEVIERVLAAVTARAKVSFKEMTAGDRGEVIVSFLAILEMMRKNLITAEQGDHFDDILVSQETPSP